MSIKFIAFFVCILSFSVYTNAQRKIIIQTDDNAGEDALVWKLYGKSKKYGDVEDRNWGDYKFLKLTQWTWGGVNGEQEVLLKFNLPELNKNKIISAKLTLSGVVDSGKYVEGHSSLSGLNDFIISRITEDWSEDNVTWNTKPQYSKENQIVVSGTNSLEEDFIDIDVTKLVQDSYTQSNDFFGFNISMKQRQYYRRLVFASFQFEEINKRPKLEILYKSSKKDRKNKKNRNNSSPNNYTIVIYDSEGKEIQRIENVKVNSKGTKTGMYNFNLIKDKNVKASGKVIVY